MCKGIESKGARGLKASMTLYAFKTDTRGIPQHKTLHFWILRSMYLVSSALHQWNCASTPWDEL